MMQWLRRVLYVGAALLLLFIAIFLVTARPGDPNLFPAGGEGVDILLVSNGYHAGLVVPVEALASSASDEGLSALIPVATRFRQFGWIEVGWGDADFYRATPDAASVQWRLALNALLGLGSGSVLHVVGITEDPAQIFRDADIVRIRLSQQGFARLARQIDRSFALGPEQQPEILGPGLYGPSLFYRAVGRFNFFRVCNHWIADMLDAAGVPTTPAVALLPLGILSDLKWRSGLSVSSHL